MVEYTGERTYKALKADLSLFIVPVAVVFQYHFVPGNELEAHTRCVMVDRKLRKVLSITDSK